MAGSISSKSLLVKLVKSLRIAGMECTPTNSSEFPKPELGRAILMEASGLKFTPPPNKIPPPDFFLKRIPKAGLFFCLFLLSDVFFSFKKKQELTDITDTFCHSIYSKKVFLKAQNLVIQNFPGCAVGVERKDR